MEDAAYDVNNIRDPEQRERARRLLARMAASVDMRGAGEPPPRTELIPREDPDDTPPPFLIKDLLPQQFEPGLRTPPE